MLRYAIIGFGGLGKIHCSNLIKMERERGDIQLCAIANSDLSSISKPTAINIASASSDEIDFSKYNLYTDYKELLEKEKPDFVICTLPTYLHADATITAMKNGAHVFCEKPMALTKEQCFAMAEASEKYGKRLMIGQVLRFSQEYMKCKEIVESGIYGKVLRAEFSRKSPLPDWSYQNWMLDMSKSGGCIIDMHVHDTDMINYLFGKAKSVYSCASHYKAEFESVYSTFEYEDKFVTSIADWGLPSRFVFDYRFSITMEKAIVDYKDTHFTISTNNTVEEITYSDITGEFVNEMNEFVDCIVSGKEFKTTPLTSVLNSMDMVYAEAEAAKTGKKVYI